jgi:nucleoid DNA-binding protein
MLKRELVKAVAKEANETEALARKVLDAMDRVVRGAIAAGRPVMLAGLGKLFTRRRGPKKARHMVDGSQVIVPERTVVLLKPSDGLLAAANGQH